MRKRTWFTFAALILAAAVLGATAHASGNRYTEKDLVSMRNSLLGKAPLTEGQDVNGDGHVDVFDMIRMRRGLILTGDFSVKSCPVTEDHVKYTGRNYYNNGTVWLVQSGSAIEFSVEARSAEITLRGEMGMSGSKDMRPRYAVVVDGEIVRDDVLNSTEETVELFSGEEVRCASVKVIHLSEAANGAVGVSAVTADCCTDEPVTPAEEKKLRIEFIGDSITCGYGVDAPSQYESFRTTTENFMKSYAYLAAEMLGADYSAVCYSGYGIISGYTPDGTKNAANLVPAYYECYGRDYPAKWDFSAKPNDVVIINLGTNDSTYIDRDPDSRGAEFIKAYSEFLTTVRKNNPDAHIICTLGIMGASSEYKMIEQAIAEYRQASGDSRIYCYQAPVQVSADGYGADWHPSAATQEKNAGILAEKIRQVLGSDN